MRPSIGGGNVSGTRLLRIGAVVVLGAALLVQPAAGVLAEGGGGLDTSKMDPKLRAHVSGLLDLALTADANSAAQAERQTNFFPRADECSVQRGGNVKINQNCLNVSDSNLQGRG